MFDDIWQSRYHVVPESEVPSSWLRPVVDWGSSAPFSVLWWAESDGTDRHLDGRRMSTVRGDLFLRNRWWLHSRSAQTRAQDDCRRSRQRNQSESSPVSEQNPDARSCRFIYLRRREWTLSRERHGLDGVRWDAANKGPGPANEWLGETQRMLRRPSRTANREKSRACSCRCCNDFIETFPVLPRSRRIRDDADLTRSITVLTPPDTGRISREPN